MDLFKAAIFILALSGLHAQNLPAAVMPVSSQNIPVVGPKAATRRAPQPGVIHATRPDLSQKPVSTKRPARARRTAAASPAPQNAAAQPVSVEAPVSEQPASIEKPAPAQKPVSTKRPARMRRTAAASPTPQNAAAQPASPQARPVLPAPPKAAPQHPPNPGHAPALSRAASPLPAQPPAQTGSLKAGFRPTVPALNAGSGDTLSTYENPEGEEMENAARSRKYKARRQATNRKHANTTQGRLPPPPAPGATITMIDTIYGILRHHREVRLMQEDREVMKHELARARRAFGPSVDIDATGGTSVINDSSTRRHDLYYRFLGLIDVSARLTQPIWDGFATRSRVRSAQSILNSVVNRIFDTATTLSLDGIIAQIDLLRRRTLYDLAQKNVETHNMILNQTLDRSGMGVDTEADVTQAHSRLSRALSDMAEAQEALITAEDVYGRLTGLQPGKKIQPVPMAPVLYDNTKQVLDQAERYNPKILASIEDIRALQADRQLAESEYYPNINIQAGPTHTNRNRWDDRWTTSFEVTANLNWNIFNSGMDVEAVRAAGARIREARQDLYNLIDGLKLEIQTTWIDYQAAKDQYARYAEAIKFNEYTCAAYMEQFQMGRRTLLDVLDAENELYNSSTQAETAAGNILVGAYRLMAIAGILLPALKIDLRPLDLNPERDPKDSRENFDPGWFK